MAGDGDESLYPIAVLIDELRNEVGLTFLQQTLFRPVYYKKVLAIIYTRGYSFSEWINLLKTFQIKTLCNDYLLIEKILWSVYFV